MPFAGCLSGISASEKGAYLEVALSISAGISACEKGAQWDVAPSVLRVKPQYVCSFSAGISAC